MVTLTLTISWTLVWDSRDVRLRSFCYRCAECTASISTVAAVSINLFGPEIPRSGSPQSKLSLPPTTQKTRFNYVISSEFAMEVRDLLLTENPYNILKAELIKRTAASEQRKLQQLISGKKLGDHKPTQLLQQLLGDKLGPSTNSNRFLRELFLQRLPPNVWMVLASTDASMDLNKLADMVMEVPPSVTPSPTLLKSNNSGKKSHTWPT